MLFCTHLLLLLASVLLLRANVLAAEHLNVSGTAAVGGISTIQCWQLQHPFEIVQAYAGGPFMTVDLGNLTNATYSILPAGTNLGIHVAPVVQ